MFTLTKSKNFIFQNAGSMFPKKGFFLQIVRDWCWGGCWWWMEEVGSAWEGEDADQKKVRRRRNIFQGQKM